MKSTQRWTGILLMFAALGTGLVAVANYAAGQQSSGAGGKVDLNSASEKDLETLPGVGAATAKKIVAGRPYSSVSDLSKAGVSAATIDKITPLATVGNGNAATSSSSSTRTHPASNPPPSSQPSSEPGNSQAAPPSSAKSAPPSPGSGMVWVNTDTGVYHKEGSPYYGKTKNGKYMSVADAEKAGYRAAKNEK